MPTHIKVKPAVDSSAMLGIRTEIRQRRARRKLILDHQLDVKGMTMTDLSRKTGVDLSYISRIFSGDRMPGLDTTIRLAKEMGMTLQELADILLPEILIQKVREVVEATDNYHVGKAYRAVPGPEEVLGRGDRK